MSADCLYSCWRQRDSKFEGAVEYLTADNFRLEALLLCSKALNSLVGTVNFVTRKVTHASDNLSIGISSSMISLWSRVPLS